MNQPIKEGQILKKYLKATDKKLEDYAVELDMTRQGLDYHLSKAVLDPNFRQQMQVKLGIDFAKVKEWYEEKPGATGVEEPKELYTTKKEKGHVSDIKNKPLYKKIQETISQFLKEGAVKSEDLLLAAKVTKMMEDEAEQQEDKK